MNSTILFYRRCYKKEVINIPQNFIVKRYRPFKSKNDLKWQLLTFFSYQRWELINAENEIVCTAYTNKKAFIFPFMKRKSLYIGKCSTLLKHRGKGYYPLLLQWIISHNKCKELFYLVITDDNIASIKGVMKAGFAVYAKGHRDCLKRYIVDVTDN